jgi:hypothetical protein
VLSAGLVIRRALAPSGVGDSTMPGSPMTLTTLSAEGGFTLIELLVVMLSGMVIVMATFGLIDVTIHQTTRSMDRVQATQNARTGMEELVQELNSGCLVAGVSPVQAASAAGITPAVNTDARDLVFVTALGSGATATPVEHVVSLNNGTLTDASYASTGGSGPTAYSPSTWTFSATPSTSRALGNVQSVTFKYYSYSNPLNSVQNSLSGTPVALQTPLNATWPPTAGIYNAAGSVAQVDIAWQVGPSDGSTDPLRLVTMNDSVVFRLTPPTSTGSNFPCN